MEETLARTIEATIGESTETCDAYELLHSAWNAFAVVPIIAPVPS